LYFNRARYYSTGPQILLPHCQLCSGNQGRAAAQMKRDGINPHTDYQCRVPVQIG